MCSASPDGTQVAAIERTSIGPTWEYRVRLVDRAGRRVVLTKAVRAASDNEAEVFALWIDDAFLLAGYQATRIYDRSTGRERGQFGVPWFELKNAARLGGSTWAFVHSLELKPSEVPKEALTPQGRRNPFLLPAPPLAVERVDLKSGTTVSAKLPDWLRWTQPMVASPGDGRTLFIVRRSGQRHEIGETVRVDLDTANETGRWMPKLELAESCEAPASP